jgi:hypothetical protein
MIITVYIVRNQSNARSRAALTDTSRLRRKSSCEKHAQRLKVHIVTSNATLTLLESELSQADVKIEHHIWAPCAKGVVPLVTRFTEMKNIKVAAH